MSEEHDCQVDTVEPDPVDEGTLERSEGVWLSVSDMGCPNCALRVRNALLTVPGVLEAEVYLAGGMATVAYEGERVAPRDLLEAVERAGDGTHHDYRAEVVPGH